MDFLPKRSSQNQYYIYLVKACIWLVVVAKSQKVLSLTLNLPTDRVAMIF